MHPGARPDVGPPPRFWTSEPRLGFGAWAIGGAAWGAAAAEPDRVAAVARAVERGVTFFDTAPVYGDGASETLLGRVLRPHRERVAIATKVGPRDEPRASLEASLRRLQTDYVDLVQLHEATDRWEWRLDDLYRLQGEGKALAIGLCNATHLQLARALELVPLAAYQGPYNVFDRDVEQQRVPLANRRPPRVRRRRRIRHGQMVDPLRLGQLRAQMRIIERADHHLRHARFVIRCPFLVTPARRVGHTRP